MGLLVLFGPLRAFPKACKRPCDVRVVAGPRLFLVQQATYVVVVANLNGESEPTHKTGGLGIGVTQFLKDFLRRPSTERRLERGGDFRRFDGLRWGTW